MDVVSDMGFNIHYDNPAPATNVGKLDMSSIKFGVVVKCGHTRVPESDTAALVLSELLRVEHLRA